MNKFNWSTAFKIAWRESRSSSVKFLFVVLAVAVGTGSLTGVRGFSRAFHDMLLREARTLMAADLSVRTFALPTQSQIAVMDELEKQGVRRTWITETISMASASPQSPPLLISIKAVDPAAYPFYGTIKLSPPASLAGTLNSQTVAVSDDLLLRLKLNLGDTIRLGGQPFRIVATVAGEPDRMAGSLNVGPRVMITREGLERTGLMLPGSRASERFLFRLPPAGPNIETVRRSLQKVFAEAMIVDFRQTHPIITNGLDRSTTFLSLVSLIAMIVGGLGVATAIQAHLQQKMDSIAIMKCLGARSGQIVRIYLTQTLALGLAGGLIGVALGTAVQRIFPLLIARYFELRPRVTWDLLSAAQGLAVGLLTTLLFTAPPLLGIRRIRPGAIFRREMQESKPGWRDRLRQSRASLAAGAAILFGIGGIAASLTTGSAQDAIKTGVYFVGGLVISLLLLAGIAWLLLRGLRKLGHRSTVKLPASIRHGIANLYRPGNHAQAALVALGIGVMFTLTVYLVQRGMLLQVNKSAPPGAPNVFLLDIAAKSRDPILQLLKQQPGITGTPEMMGTVAAKLVSVNGTSIEKLSLKGWGRRFRFTRQVTSAGERPAYAEVIRGAWWDGKTRLAAPQLSLSEEVAHTLRLEPGSSTEWIVAGRTFPARVAAIHRIDSIHLAGRVEFIFSAGALDGFPVIYYGSLRAKPALVPALQRAMYERFPTVTVVNVADVLQIVQEVVDQIALVVRFISTFAILAGVIILASSVAGTRFRRVREVVILKTLGATRRRVSAIFSVEFLILGTVAGIMGSLLASAFSSLLLKRVLHAEVHFDPLPHVICILLTAFIANAAGWLASFRILGQKPLEVLRQE